MMNEYQMKLEEGNKVTLPESLVNKLLLRKGETVCLIQEDGIKDKCFKVTAENEKEHAKQTARLVRLSPCSTLRAGILL